MPVESVLGRGGRSAPRSSSFSNRMRSKAISLYDCLLDDEEEKTSEANENKENIPPSSMPPSTRNRDRTPTEMSSSRSMATTGNRKSVADVLSTPVRPALSKKRRFNHEEAEASTEEESDHSSCTKTVTASPGPSPWCRSNKSQGCEDPRVLKSSLNSTYVAPSLGDRNLQIKIDTSDTWHDRTLKNLAELVSKNKDFVKRKNTALLGIQFVYEEGGKLKLSKEFDINTFFVSGGKEITDSLDLKLTTSGTRTFEAKTVYDFMGSDEDSNRVTKHMRDIILGYYQEAANTKLSAQTIAARQKEANFTYLSPQTQKQSEKSSCHANSGFELAYLHSEQAILLMLIRNTKVLDPFLKTLPPGATIHQMALLIASKNQMCRRCGACYFVAGSESGILTTTLQNYIQKFPKKRFQIASNSLSVFTQVSGLSVFGRVKQWRGIPFPLPATSNRTCAINASGFRSEPHAFAFGTSAMTQAIL
ncbi:hypothetical protein [Candidatus Finniella inopinata]|uniref:Uncharacterized protein n=1 Tax=Candidatus Finniella inopinata TaxID=1696036 RepID=A0A4Q7DI18_9PROT|nr:hypothetical protein [Candidatus Finniella inopinata]RZI45594.1 hypothetical protein EQU50_06625 [Candidatus Finniella inopinata]